jgi:hypothetical protein
MLETSRVLGAAVAALLAGALVSPTPVAAQETTTVTGCLSRGATEGAFSIKSEDGKSHELSSTTVPLEGHIGHTVTVTGTAPGVETGAVTDTGMVRDTGMAYHPGTAYEVEEMQEKAKEAAGTGPRALTVTSLKHESPVCS